jgi:hypothetical protein
MENILFDEKIRSLARQSELTVPGDYENNIEQLLDRLLAEEKIVPIRRHRGSKRVAAVVACCIIFGSGGAYAAFNYANQRMQQMKPEEIGDLKMEIQDSTEGADHYSRKLSDSEQNRLVKLTTKYDSEGLFPKSKILEIDSKDQILHDRLCFVSVSSTFYLPDREMTDEELLELIDFYSKRDYSIKQKNSELSSEKSTEALLGESAGVTQAAKFVKKLCGVDVSKMEYSISWVGSETDASKKLLEIQFGNTSASPYLVTVDTQKNQVVWILLGDNNYFSDAIVSDEEKFKNQYVSVKNTLQKLLGAGQNIQNAYLNYSESTSNALVKKGVLLYLCALSDGSGYELNYSCEKQQICGIRYIDDIHTDQKWAHDVAGQASNNQYNTKVIQLQ